MMLKLVDDQQRATKMHPPAQYPMMATQIVVDAHCRKVANSKIGLKTQAVVVGYDQTAATQPVLESMSTVCPEQHAHSRCTEK